MVMARYSPDFLSTEYSQLPTAEAATAEDHVGGPDIDAVHCCTQ